MAQDIGCSVADIVPPGLKEGRSPPSAMAKHFQKSCQMRGAVRRAQRVGGGSAKAVTTPRARWNGPPRNPDQAMHKIADPFYSSPLWKSIKAHVRRRSGGICEIPGCKDRAIVCDHIVSRRKGGADHPSNLRDLCRAHDNQAKEDANGNRRSGGQFIVKGCDASGRPNDPNHPWSRR